jgi:putative membrane protein
MQANGSAAESGAARAVIAALSVFVVVAVAVVVRLLPKSSDPGDALLLPTLNAGLNAFAAVCLVLGYRFIRRKNVRAHRACMTAAFSASSLFLITYLLHHARVGSVPFRGHGILRLVYFVFLVPHVLLAAVIVPLALLTLYRGYTARIVQHRRIARYTLPIWLYVSVSGVIVYLMLYHLPV